MHKGKTLTKGIFLNAVVVKLGTGKDPSMVVKVDDKGKYNNKLVTIEDRNNRDSVKPRRWNPDSRRRSMRPERHQPSRTCKNKQVGLI